MLEQESWETTWVHILLLRTRCCDTKCFKILSKKQVCPISHSVEDTFLWDWILHAPLITCWYNFSVDWIIRRRKPKIKPLHWHFGMAISSLGLGPSCLKLLNLWVIITFHFPVCVTVCLLSSQLGGIQTRAQRSSRHTWSSFKLFVFPQSPHLTKHLTEGPKNMNH